MNGGSGNSSGAIDCKAGRAVEVHCSSKAALVEGLLPAPNHLLSWAGFGAEAEGERLENQRFRRRV